MQHINTLCKNLKSFFYVVNENPIAAVLMLGNLYRCLDAVNSSDDKSQLNATLSTIKKKMTAAHVQCLWKASTEIPISRRKLMSNANRTTLKCLYHAVMVDIDFFKHLSDKDVIELGQDPEFYRESLVALIRKHLGKRHRSDPFATSDFSYETLRKAGSEQNYDYLHNYIGRCDSLPTRAIKSLGEMNSDIATLILIDIQCAHVKYFLVSSYFVDKHPGIREEIAQAWQSYFENYPLYPYVKRFVTQELSRLKEKYAEFEDVEIDDRVRADNEVEIEPSHPGMEFVYQLGIKLFCSSTCGFAFGCAASAVSVPLMLPATLGFVIGQETITPLVRHAFMGEDQQSRNRLRG